MLWYLTSSLTMALAGMVIYIYYHYSGQFDDPEEAKYHLFRDEEPPRN